MKRLTLASAALVAVLALAGCSASNGDGASDSASVAPNSVAANGAETEAVPTPSEGSAAAGSAGADSTSEHNEAAAAGTPAGASKDTVTTAYEDSYRSVFTLDKVQVGAFTGLPTESDAAAILDVFGDADLWSKDSRTAEYADLIVTAFANESGSARHALEAISRDPSAHLRVYVSHNQHARVAHVGIDGGDDEGGRNQGGSNNQNQNGS